MVATGRDDAFEEILVSFLVEDFVETLVDSAFVVDDICSNLLIEGHLA